MCILSWSLDLFTDFTGRVCFRTVGPSEFDLTDRPFYLTEEFVESGTFIESEVVAVTVLL